MKSTLKCLNIRQQSKQSILKITRTEKVQARLTPTLSAAAEWSGFVKLDEKIFVIFVIVSIILGILEYK